MKIEHYLSFHKNQKQVIKLLEKNNISYSTKSYIYSFSMFEDDPFYNKLQKFIINGSIFDSPANAKYYYSKEDISNSEWFCIRSTHHWSYPQPEEKYLEVIYNLENYCNSCGYGKIQKNNFRMKKEPSWGRRNFMHLHWAMDELFINSKILDKFLKQDFNGIDIKRVKSTNGAKYLNAVNQLYIKNIAKCDFKNLNIAKQINCLECNNQKRVLSFTGFMYCSLETVKNFSHDFIKSEEVFGDGTMAAHKIIVSRKALKFFVDNNINEIVFTPIITI